MAELKTKPTGASVAAFIDAIPDETRREDCRAVAKIMQRVTRSEPKMWGSSLVGFGSYHYKYASGQEGDWPLAGFSPRKGALTLYLMGAPQNPLLRKLGKVKTGVGCVYVKKLSDIDLGVLTELVKASVKEMKQIVVDRKRAAAKA